MSYFCFTERKVSVRWFPLHSIMYFPNLELCVSGLAKENRADTTCYVSIRNETKSLPKKLFFQLTNVNRKVSMIWVDILIKLEIVFKKKTNCICYSILLQISVDKSHLPKKSWYLFDLKNNHTEGDYVLPMNQSLV